MREVDLIDRIRTRFGSAVSDGAFRFSDDAAVLPAVTPGATRVVTADMSVDGRDFVVGRAPPASISHRALLANLSDLSAMGARPIGFTWSLAIPLSIVDDDAFLDAFLDGAADLATRTGIQLFGGDLSGTDGGLVVSICAFGDVAGSPLRRSGARPGDRVWVAGRLGASRRGLRAHLADHQGPTEAIDAHLWHHDVDLTVGPRLVGRATSALDLSDGLLKDAQRLARASDVGLRLENLARAAALIDGRSVDDEDVLVGGEDFHLLYTLPPGDDGLGAPHQPIGVVVEERGVFVDGVDVETLALDGFDHFT